MINQKITNFVLLVVIMSSIGCVNTTSITKLLTSITSSHNLIYTGSNGRTIELTNLPKSQYFYGVYVAVGRMYFNEEMCIRLNEKSLWEHNDTAEAMHTHFTDSTNYQLSVDSHSFSLEDHMLYWQSGLTYKSIFDRNGSVIGSYSDLEYCFMTEQLPIGNHLAQIILITTSGQQHSYSWNFFIAQKPSK